MKSLVLYAENAGKSLEQLEDLKAELANMPTDQVVSGYLGVKGLADRAKAFTEAVRAELLFASPESEKSKTYDGRFFKEGSEDAKGSRFLMGVEGVGKLKAERRLTVTLNPDRAVALLRERNLLQSAVDETVKIDVDQLVSVVREAIEVLKHEGAGRMADDLTRVLDSGSVVQTLNENKIEALVALGHLDVNVAQQMYNTVETFALKETK